MTTEELKTLIAGYCATRPEIVACYLFGSRATGKSRMGSDLDVAFLLDSSVSSKSYFAMKMAYITGLANIVRLDIHPLVMNDVGEVVLQQIFAKGIPLYGFESLECIRFKMIQVAQIAEFNPIRNRMEELLFRKYKEVRSNG